MPHIRKICRSKQADLIGVAPLVITARIDGSDTASALGVTVTSPSPVPALCRELLAAGFDPATPLEAYRGPTLCLRIRSIGEAAQLEVTSWGVGFTCCASRRRPPVAPTAPARIGQRARRKAA
jgi:hypothetical protein